MPFPPFPSVPSPATWVNGPVLTSSLRNDVTNAVNFLSQRPLFVGQMTTGASTGSGTDAPMALTGELVDTWNGHNTASGNWQTYYCQFPGWYLCQSFTPFAYTTATQILFSAGMIAKTGGVTQTVVRGQLQLMGSGKHPGPKCCDLIQMSATGPIGGGGDSVTPTALQISGSTLSYLATPASLLPFFSVRWVSALSGTAGLPVPVNASWPVPTAYITPAFLNTNIRDTINFLAYPPVCKAYYTAGSSSLPNQAFPNGTVVPLNTIMVDNYGGFTTGGSGGYTAPVAGVYLLAAQVNFASYNSAGGVAYSAGLSVNGGTIQWGDSVFQSGAQTTGAGACVRRRLRLNAGDYVQFYGQQSTGGSLNLNATGSNQTRFIALWEGS